MEQVEQTEFVSTKTRPFVRLWLGRCVAPLLADFMRIGGLAQKLAVKNKGL